MPLTATDFLYPPDGTGEIRREWFAGEDVAAALTLRIAAGEALAPVGATSAQVDAIARAYTYRETYDAKAMQVAGTPDSVGLEGVSVTNSTSRVKLFLAKRDEWAAALVAAVAEAAPVAPAPPTFTPRPSRAVGIIRHW